MLTATATVLDQCRGSLSPLQVLLPRQPQAGRLSGFLAAASVPGHPPDRGSRWPGTVLGVRTGDSPSLCCLGETTFPHLLGAWLTAHVPSSASLASPGTDLDTGKKRPLCPWAPVPPEALSHCGAREGTGSRGRGEGGRSQPWPPRLLGPRSDPSDCQGPARPPPPRLVLPGAQALS